MVSKTGEANIKTSYPKSEVNKEDKVNLTPEGINGIKSIVSKKLRKGLE